VLGDELRRVLTPLLRCQLAEGLSGEESAMIQKLSPRGPSAPYKQRTSHLLYWDANNAVGYQMRQVARRAVICWDNGIDLCLLSCFVPKRFAWGKNLKVAKLPHVAALAFAASGRGRVCRAR